MLVACWHSLSGRIRLILFLTGIASAWCVCWPAQSWPNESFGLEIDTCVLTQESQVAQHEADAVAPRVVKATNAVTTADATNHGPPQAPKFTLHGLVLLAWRRHIPAQIGQPEFWHIRIPVPAT